MKKVTFLWLLGPLMALVLLGIIILIVRTGVIYENRSTSVDFLPEDFVISSLPEEKASSVIIYNSDYDVSVNTKSNIAYVLDSMKVSFDTVDLIYEELPDLSKYSTAVLAISDYELLGERYLQFTQWVRDGGRAFLAIAPAYSPVFEAIYAKLGIQYCTESYLEFDGVKFITDFMIGSKELEMEEGEFEGNSLALQVTEDSTKHMVALGEEGIPILWEHDYGKGKFVVYNYDNLGYKDSRGIIAASYSLLEDVFVYPVINASMYFIDDFPAPIPEGYYPTITEDYGRDIAGFYQNIWWPDIISLSDKYGVKYTGLLVETYNDKTSAPFTGAEEDLEVYYNYGAMLLNSGGELGLHGYNHMPLCLESFDYKGKLDYKKWSSKNNMKEALDELNSFARELFPDNEFNTYVPPSNILSSEGREVLAESYPNIKVISGSYLPETNYEIEQEFDVSSDGMINVPRVVSGCDINPYMQWVAFNELNFHYVNSHFLHPDDVLDVDRGADKGWAYLAQRFEEYINWVDNSAPGIRNMTARQGAAAVERYHFLTVQDTYEDNKLKIAIGGFFDEAWFLVRINKGKPGEVLGGSLEHVTGNLYLLQAKDPSVIINITGMR